MTHYCCKTTVVYRNQLYMSCIIFVSCIRSNESNSFITVLSLKWNGHKILDNQLTLLEI